MNQIRPHCVYMCISRHGSNGKFHFSCRTKGHTVHCRTQIHLLAGLSIVLVREEVFGLVMVNNHFLEHSLAQTNACLMH